MIWVKITDERSLQAFGVNVAKHGDEHRLYIERTAGNSQVIFTGDKETAMLHKEAIDWAIKNGHASYDMTGGK